MKTLIFVLDVGGTQTYYLSMQNTEQWIGISSSLFETSCPTSQPGLQQLTPNEVLTETSKAPHASWT